MTFIYRTCAFNSKVILVIISFKEILLSISNVPALSEHYSSHLQSHWLMHEEYLYGDIPLHFSYLAQCLANLEQILKSISNLNRSGLKNHGPPSLYHVFLAESNYKMPQSPILSQRCVIKKTWPFLSLSPSGDCRITKRLTCALHYHHINGALKLSDRNVIRAFCLFHSLILFSFSPLVRQVQQVRQFQHHQRYPVGMRTLADQMVERT